MQEFIIKIQAAARGHMTRKYEKYRVVAITKVQALHRGSSGRVLARSKHSVHLQMLKEWEREAEREAERKLEAERRKQVLAAQDAEKAAKLALVRDQAELMIARAEVCPPELKVSSPAHTKQLGWYVEFESRVTQADSDGYAKLELTADVGVEKAPDVKLPPVKSISARGATQGSDYYANYIHKQELQRHRERVTAIKPAVNTEAPPVRP